MSEFYGDQIVGDYEYDDNTLYCMSGACDGEVAPGEAYCDDHLNTADPDDLWNDQDGRDR